jgi:hypothetical protein
MMQVNKTLAVIACRESGQIRIAQLGAQGEPKTGSAYCEAPPDARVLFGGRGVAVGTSAEAGDLWRIGAWGLHRPTLQMKLPPECTAIGLVRSHDERATGLITLDRAGGHDFLRLRSADGGVHSLYESADRVVAHAVCPTSGLVAFTTQRRQFIVVSAITRDLRLVVQTARQKHASC